MTRDLHASTHSGYPPMAVHTFILSTEPKTAADLARCGTYSVRSSRASATHVLARVMVAAGEVDGPVSAYGEDGRLRFTVRSLHALAKFTITENPGVRRAKWVPISADAFSRGAVPGTDGAGEG
jgi:hypothetical protein